MSNQASEDRLDTDTQIMHKIDYILYSEHEQPFSKGDALLMLIRNQINAHVRTEKLKLLAEVRERVVGEDEPLDVQSDYDKLDVPHPETDRYPGLDGVRQASRNLCRERQRVALTKMEAEL